jgi:predicted ester cyclase
MTSERIEASTAVTALLAAATPQSKLGQLFLNFVAALLDPDPSKIDAVVTPDARFHELEAMGMPPGPRSLKLFRAQLNTAFPDQTVRVVAMRFEGTDVIETDLEVRGTHLGELRGIAATGKPVSFHVHTRNRFVDGLMAERWDTADFQDILRQLKTV